MNEWQEKTDAVYREAFGTTPLSQRVRISGDEAIEVRLAVTQGIRPLRQNKDGTPTRS